MKVYNTTWHFYIENIRYFSETNSGRIFLSKLSYKNHPEVIKI